MPWLMRLMSGPTLTHLIHSGCNLPPSHPCLCSAQVTGLQILFPGGDVVFVLVYLIIVEHGLFAAKAIIMAITPDESDDVITDRYRQTAFTLQEQNDPM